ncbi:hypothetical protein GG344DRAFT_9994, partial [Lentinula edodes]
VADGISRKDEGLPEFEGDGSSWSVSEDWESSRGLAQDVMALEEEESNEFVALRRRFSDEPVFSEVVNALANLKSNASVRVKARAEHRAKGYMIEDGKLWKVGGRGARARPRVECVTKEEAVALARIQHADGGHWGRDSVKIALLDRICSPKLDESILKAI